MRSCSEMCRVAQGLLLMSAIATGACSTSSDGSFDAPAFRRDGFDTILAFDLRQDPRPKAALLLEKMSDQAQPHELVVLPFSTTSVTPVADIALASGSYFDYTVITFVPLVSSVGPQGVAFVPSYETTAPDSFEASHGVLYFVADNQERTFAYIPKRAEAGSLRERAEALATARIDAVAVALPGSARPLEVAESASLHSTNGPVRFYKPVAQSGLGGRVIVRYLVPLTPTQNLVAATLAKLFPVIAAPLVAIFLLKSGEITDPTKRKRVLIVAGLVELVIIAGLVYYSFAISGAAGVQLGIDAIIVIIGTVLTAISMTLKRSA
jgi:hypothetical protein